MTCIVGLAQHGKVWIGADSASSDGNRLRIRQDPKVFQTGKFLIGFTTSWRMGQLLRYSFTPPDHDPRMDAHKFMATAFIGAVRRCLKSGGWAVKEKEQESGGSFLVGYDTSLYEIDSDYQVGIPADGIATIGCGSQVAAGAMNATQELEPEERIRRALRAAEMLTDGVRGPFIILSSGRPEAPAGESRP